MSFVETIELVPDASGAYIPDFNPQPATAAPIVPFTAPFREAATAPPPAPAPARGSRGLTDRDLADFGTDQYGRPVVTRDPSGRARFNPDLGFAPAELQQAEQALDRNPGNRTSRRRSGSLIRNAGRVGRNLPGIGTLADTIAVGDALSDAIARPLGSALGRGIRNAANAIDEALGIPIPDRLRDPLPGAPTGTIDQPGLGEPEVGQCDVLYRVDGVGSYYSSFRDSREITNLTAKTLRGPIGNARVVQSGNLIEWLVDGLHRDTGQPVTERLHAVTASLGFVANGAFEELTIERLDGQPDNCGERGPAPQPYAPPTNPDTSPAPFPPIPSPYSPAPTPSPSPAPFPFPQPLPLPLAGPYPVGSPSPLPSPLPFPQPLPQPQPTTPPISPPTPAPQCCPSTDRSLETIEELLRTALERLQGSISGEIDLTPCDAESPSLLAFGGEGLDGIYSAIAAFTDSLNTIHTDTKCPPDVDAVLPMHWDIKRGEIPQLVVSWKKIDGGNSKWSMNIPHPREEIGPDYPFSFPDYQKGGNMASVRLIDNSQLIINAFSEAEAQKVVDYITTTLIDPVFIPETGVKMVYSKNVADYAEVQVTAVYAKKFTGHKTTVPTWATRLTE